MSKPITYGTYKGERGYWEWRGKRCHFVAANTPQRRAKADGLQIIKDIEPFQNIAVDNGVVGGRRQRRDMMRAHGLEEVGNERPRETPLKRYIDDRNGNRPDRSIVEALKKNSGGKWL